MGKHSHRDTGHLFSWPWGHPSRAVMVLLALKSSDLEKDLPYIRGGGGEEGRELRCSKVQLRKRASEKETGVQGLRHVLGRI